MTIQQLPFSAIPQFSERDKAYVAEDSRLRPFYQYPVTVEAFAEVIDQRSAYETDRKLLVDVLQAQYTSLPDNKKVLQQIQRLGETTTFTVTTAHQPSLFTGPLYFIYKIASTIHLSRKLNERYPDQHFVPVFVTGGEDHDFEEINHAHIFGKRLEWQQETSGSVGRMQTDSLKPVLEELKEILGTSENAQALYERIHRAYTGFPRYAQATQALVHDLFGAYGLVVLSMDEPRLKASFAPFIQREILEQPSRDLVMKAQQELEEVGFSGQAYPREINFFYLGDGFRERIIQEDNVFKVLNQPIQFSEAELRKEIEENPERFSPNVVMRPLYQEHILPNLAYIGGGGELAYWLERKEQFASFGLPYPMLIRRNSVLWIDKTSAKRMDKLSLTVEDLMGDVEGLIKEFVRRNSEEELSFSDQKRAIAKIYAGIAEKTKEIDPTLVKTVKAEQANTMNALGNLEGRLVKAEKQKQQTAVNQIRKVHEKLFPHNGLQERYDNFIPFYLKHGDDYLETLVRELNPLKKDLLVIREN